MKKTHTRAFLILWTAVETLFTSTLTLNAAKFSTLWLVPRKHSFAHCPVHLSPVMNALQSGFVSAFYHSRRELKSITNATAIKSSRVNYFSW